MSEIASPVPPTPANPSASGTSASVEMYLLPEVWQLGWHKLNAWSGRGAMSTCCRPPYLDAHEVAGVAKACATCN
jgi:hypothetical protein